MLGGMASQVKKAGARNWGPGEGGGVGGDGDKDDEII